MQYSMKGTLALAAIATLAMGGIANAQERVVFGGGARDASFYSSTVVDTIIDGLAETRITRYEWGGPTQGTPDNIERVKANPRAVGVGQLDVIQAYLLENDDPGIMVLIENLGPECYYLATSNPGYDNFGHVIGNAFDIRIATTGEKSGSFASWNALIEIYPDLADAEVQHYDNANDAVEAVAEGKADFVFFVQRPTPGSGPFELIAQKELNYVSVVDFDMEDIGLEFFSLPVTSSSFNLAFWNGGAIKEGQKVETACTSIAVFTGDPANGGGKLLEAIIDRVPANADKFQLPQDKSWLDMLNSMESLAGDRIAELAKAAKDAMEDATN